MQQYQLWLWSSLKEQCDQPVKKKVTFRSYKLFDKAQFNEDLSRVSFHVAQIFDDTDDVYWAYKMLLNMRPSRKNAQKEIITSIYELCVSEINI